jgi:hypothetical protein
VVDEWQDLFNNGSQVQTMTTRAKTRPEIRHEPIDVALKNLEDEVRAYEIRFKQTSEEALLAVKAGRLRETADIARWLIDHQVLEYLRGQAQAGPTTGTH